MDTENFLSSKASKPKSRCSLWTQDQHFDGTLNITLNAAKANSLQVIINIYIYYHLKKNNVDLVTSECNKKLAMT